MTVKNIFKISGMSCNHCVKSIEEAIKLPGIDKYDVTIGSLYVEYNPDVLTKEKIIAAIEEAGYEVAKTE